LIGVETLTTLPSSVPRVKLEFAYDYMSRRVSKQVSNIISGQWSVVSSHAFLHDSWNLISEICNHESQIITNLYVHGLDLSGTLQGAGGIGGIIAARLETNNVAYTCDANGNVSELISASGTVVGHYEYSPFGETIVATGPLAKENTFRFSTKFTDDETGLLYYGYRYYSPSPGRWLSRDPLGESGFELSSRRPKSPQEIKRELVTARYSELQRLFPSLVGHLDLPPIMPQIQIYSFVQNNPLNEIDPHGLFILDAQIAIVIAAAAATLAVTDGIPLAALCSGLDRGASASLQTVGTAAVEALLEGLGYSGYSIAWNVTRLTTACLDCSFILSVSGPSGGGSGGGA
jgi:RHS repeat-associated protein